MENPNSNAGASVTLEKLAVVKTAFEKYLDQTNPNDLTASLYFKDIEMFINNFAIEKPEIEFKIYPDGAGLSWSTITELIDNTDDLKLLTVDLIEQREVIKSRLQFIEKLYNRLQSNLEFNLGNIGQILTFAQRMHSLHEVKFAQDNKLYYIEPRPDNHIYFGVDNLI